MQISVTKDFFSKHNNGSICLLVWSLFFADFAEQRLLTKNLVSGSCRAAAEIITTSRLDNFFLKVVVTAGFL